MIPMQATKYPHPFARHVTVATFALATSAALLLSVDSAHAGKKEIAALQAALGATTISLATTDQLADAVIAAANANPNLNVGTIAGEAMKLAGSNAPDIGTVIAER